MKWLIIDSKGEKIACFLLEADRDICFEAMVEYWGVDAGLDTDDTH